MSGEIEVSKKADDAEWSSILVALKAAGPELVTTKPLPEVAVAIDEGLLAFPRAFFSSFDKSDQSKAGGGEGEA